ncbi:MAG: PAS domain-containing protein, partial [Bacteroidales bacterium]|nr:PAS domain-containing protein [Bacteroidales bacterium]
EKDVEEFWINFKDKKIQISYYALRNEQKEYMGVLEVSQDITEVQKRTGEKRLVNE